MSLYVKSTDENALFHQGVTSWRMDPVTYSKLRETVARATWAAADSLPAKMREECGHIPEKPVGTLGPSDLADATSAIETMLNDAVLLPGINDLGGLRVLSVELQNGALDANWHHDGLSGKRHGHAGDFFSISYFGDPKWGDDDGGHFEYSTRQLGEEWTTSGFVPDGPIHRIAPAARTTLLGWNQNPTLIHRTAPLHAERDRITLIAAVEFAKQP